jgi:hypothetical protein
MRSKVVYLDVTFYWLVPQMSAGLPPIWHKVEPVLQLLSVLAPGHVLYTETNMAKNFWLSLCDSHRKAECCAELTGTTPPMPFQRPSKLI